MDVNQTVSFPGGATKNLLGGATKSLLGGKYKVDNKSNHDCSNCPSFLSREEEEDHLELINRVRAKKRGRGRGQSPPAGQAKALLGP